jgi:hypothetical protein
MELHFSLYNNGIRTVNNGTLGLLGGGGLLNQRMRTDYKFKIM